jgi:hypothetical protein
MNAPLDPPQPASGFWQRQYQAPKTSFQHAFDLFFGIIAPLLCLIFDPAVFRSDGPLMGNGFLGQYRLFGYSAVAESVAVLCYYLLVRHRSPLVSGALLGSALFSFSLGVLMLPLSIFGLIMIIGIFGFTPFLTSFVYFRNACQCWRETFSCMSFKSAILRVTIGFSLILGIPAGLQGSASYLHNRMLLTLQVGSDEDYERTVKEWKRFRLFLDSDKIVFAFEKKPGGNQRERLLRAYKAISGRDLSERLVELRD